MNNLEKFLTTQNAFWRWDGHKHVARLASGKLSDFYANCSPVFTLPVVQNGLAEELANKVCDNLTSFVKLSQNVWFVGSAQGATGLAQSLAFNEGLKSAFTEPADEQPDEDDIMSGNSATRKVMKLKRFDLGEEPFVILCEDVVTTGGTTIKTIKGILEKHPDAQFFTEVLALVNRNPGKKIETGQMSFGVTSLYEYAAKVWDEGHGPAEMNDCVPLKPKENWEALTTEKI